jgi:hypothetical protein
MVYEISYHTTDSSTDVQSLFHGRPQMTHHLQALQSMHSIRSKGMPYELDKDEREKINKEPEICELRMKLREIRASGDRKATQAAKRALDTRRRQRIDKRVKEIREAWIKAQKSTTLSASQNVLSEAASHHSLQHTRVVQRLFRKEGGLDDFLNLVRDLSILSEE